jgi:hypothetical protein
MICSALRRWVSRPMSLFGLPIRFRNSASSRGWPVDNGGALPLGLDGLHLQADQLLLVLRQILVVLINVLVEAVDYLVPQLMSLVVATRI